MVLIGKVLRKVSHEYWEFWTNVGAISLLFTSLVFAMSFAVLLIPEMVWKNYIKK